MNAEANHPTTFSADRPILTLSQKSLSTALLLGTRIAHVIAGHVKLQDAELGQAANGIKQMQKTQVPIGSTDETIGGDIQVQRVQASEKPEHLQVFGGPLAQTVFMLFLQLD